MARPVHLLHVFSTFEPGGPQVRTAELIRHLPERFVHSILAMDRQYGCRDRVPAERVRAWLDFEPRGGAMFPLRIAKFVLQQQPDLVLTYNWGAMDTVLGCRLRGRCRVVHHEDGFGPDEQVRQKRRRVLTRRLLLRSTRRVVVPSRNLERIATKQWRLPAQLVRYIPNGIDVTRFAPIEAAPCRDRLGIPRDAIVIGTVGHLRAEKNYTLLLESFAQVAQGEPRAFLLIVGDGVERQRLEARTRELSITDRALFTGRLADPREAYGAMDVFVLSSKTEQMPVSVLEAMAMAKPIVSTAVGDVREMVSRGNRALIVAEAEHAATLVRLVRDADTRTALGIANRQHCLDTYPDSSMVQAYAAVFDQALR